MITKIRFLFIIAPYLVFLATKLHKGYFFHFSFSFIFYITHNTENHTVNQNVATIKSKKVKKERKEKPQRENPQFSF